jgi:FkbM family methyltransferase
MSDPIGLAEQFLRRIDGLNRAARPAPVTGRSAAPLRASCAVVLVVKDEAHDIAAWLAWYHVLGFDACIVYDDDSTDGTWDILRTASSVQDIRLSRTVGEKPGPYEHRQDECYRRALRDYGEEFDWLAFFDADEFLHLIQDSDVKRFLARFPEADAVAINWCNYGSSFHIVKPDAPVFEAFTWHGGRHQHVNRHVKSIVRPAKVGTQWHNVHCFDVPAERYALSNGQSPIWHETRGIIAGDPDWDVAKLIHYQCRSMEHFVERMKKRPALSTIHGIWYACDLRDAQSSIPEHLGDAVKAQMRRLRQQVPVPEAMATPPAVIFDIGMSEGDDTEFYLAKGFRVVGVEPDIQTYLALCERFGAALKSGRLCIHNCAASRHAGHIVTFHHHNRSQGLSGLFNDRREFAPGTYESYPVLTIDWPALLEKHGTPYFVKIDIEGNETAFLEGIAATDDLPEYVSVECHQLTPVEMLHRIGYRRFKLVDQNPSGGFAMNEPQLEGNHVPPPASRHASGPFGRDLPGQWVDFDEFKRQWQSAQPNYSHTWFDCHAWLAPAGAPPCAR